MDKKTLYDCIEKNRDVLIDLSDHIWEFAELSMLEYKSAEYYCQLLEKLVFTGDILVNIRELTAEQAHYNHYAPYLMTSVDTDPALCATERKELPKLLGPGRWHIFGGHGPRKELVIE